MPGGSIPAYTENMGIWRRNALVGALVGGMVAACGLSSTGTGAADLGAGDGSSPQTSEGGFFAEGGAIVDGMAADDGGSATTDASTDARADATSGKDAGSVTPVTYACGGGNVNACTACAGKGTVIGCIYCTTGGVVGGCLDDGRMSSCGDNIPAGATMCPCSTSYDCPNDRQVCVNNKCTICGEEYSDKRTCRNGKMCARDMDLCK